MLGSYSDLSESLEILPAVIVQGVHLVLLKVTSERGLKLLLEKTIGVILSIRPTNFGGILKQLKRAYLTPL